MTEVTRVFLGWDGPVLPRVAAWLLESGAPPLEAGVVVVPGRRAGRLLLSHLVSLIEKRQDSGRGFVPPRVVTPGALPELFYRPSRAIATRRERVLAWCEALGSRSEISGRIALARDLVRCQEELAEEGLRLADVPEHAATVTSLDTETERWRSFANLEQRELALLDARGRADPTVARLSALASEDPPPPGPPVVLCCVASLRGLERRFLARFAAQVTALIAAPESEAASFDGWGSVDVSAWRKRQVTVPKEALIVVGRPRDQARTVATQVSESLGANGVRSTAAWERAPVTVGLADSSLAAVVVEALADRDLTVHDAVGRPLAASAPWRLLQSAGRYASKRDAVELARLVRHPDLERYLDPFLEAAVTSAPDPATRELRSAIQSRDWLTALDHYTSETALEATAGALPGDAAGAALVSAADAAIFARLGDGNETLALAEWTTRIRDFFLAVYGERRLGDGDADRALSRALERLGDELRSQSESCALADGGPTVRLADAIDLLLGEVAGEALGVESDPDAIEMVGWLELPLDDAPRLVVAGLDESSASAAFAGGLLVPPLRRSLGLQDADTLHARDLYYLELLMASRETTFITGRRGAQGEPLAPRRILLAGPTRELVETVLTFWGESGKGRDEMEELGAMDRESAFGPILPSPEAPLPTRLPATAFRDYLACPYRFYLRHVLGLRPVNDLPRELPPGDFGRLLHTVLGRFARSPAASSDDAEVIARALIDLLEEEAILRSGALPRVAVRLQLEQLRRRLRSFAWWQAAQTRDGWSIDPDLVETRMEATLDVDGSPFVVSGRIDRVDRHPTAGARLLDYKSAEQSSTPEQAHRAGGRRERRWIDLQLPLYELMLRQRAGAALSGVAIELGFVNLGHRLSADPLAVSGWSAADLDDARSTAHDVVRAIRARRFWPPGEAPSYSDGLEGLAGDAFPDRARYLGAGR